MKQTGDNFFCDLVGEEIQIILTRSVYDKGIESVWTEGIVRGAYLWNGIPMFLLEQDDEIKLGSFDQAHGRMRIKLMPQGTYRAPYTQAGTGTVVVP